MDLISLLIAGVVLVLILWVVRELVAAAKIPEPIGRMIYVIAVVIAVLWFLAQIAGRGPTFHLR